VAGSSAVALARTDDGKLLAYVADADEPTLHTVDVAAGAEIAVTALEGAPEQVLVLADGRVAVTLRHEDKVQILEPKASSVDGLAERCSVPVAVEPIAMAETPTGDVLVTSGWGAKLTQLKGRTMETVALTDLPREPRAVVVSDDGQRAFVSHLVDAKMSVVELTPGAKPRELSLATRRVAAPNLATADDARRGCQGYALAKAIDVTEKPGDRIAPPPAAEQPPPVMRVPAPTARPEAVRPPKPLPAPGRVFAPMVTVNPGAPGRVAYYGSNDGLSTEESMVSVVDEKAERVLTRSVLAVARRTPTPSDACLLPRSAAYSKGALYVACLGIDAVVELDGRALDPSRSELRRWSVPSGPTGLAVDPDGERVVTWSQFDRALSVVSLTDGARPAILSLSRRAGSGPAGAVALGRVLYHRTGDKRISVEGMSCASCHPDGREDAITWGTIEGPRQTPMLAGRLADTAPYSWTGAHKTLEEHLKDTVGRLRGSGLNDNELSAIAQYMLSLEGPRVPKKHDDALVAAGAELFNSAETACATCHEPGRAFQDAHVHDVEMPTGQPRALDTPSLRFLAGSAPYFHDGRYATLEQMLDAGDHAMGHSTQLTREQRRALVAYLETL
jgi:mono/diheme cytochrome c family protein